MTEGANVKWLKYLDLCKQITELPAILDVPTHAHTRNWLVLSNEASNFLEQQVRKYVEREIAFVAISRLTMADFLKRRCRATSELRVGDLTQEQREVLYYHDWYRGEAETKKFSSTVVPGNPRETYGQVLNGWTLSKTRGYRMICDAIVVHVLSHEATKNTFSGTHGVRIYLLH